MSEELRQISEWTRRIKTAGKDEIEAVVAEMKQELSAEGRRAFCEGVGGAGEERKYGQQPPRVLPEEVPGTPDGNLAYACRKLCLE